VFCIIVKRYNNKAKVVTHINLYFRGRINLILSLFLYPNLRGESANIYHSINIGYGLRMKIVGCGFVNSGGSGG
jgi:hypothetical protein